MAGTTGLARQILGATLLTVILLGLSCCSGKALRAAIITTKSVEIIQSGSAFVEAVTREGAKPGQP